jgi:hypothetical protein
MLFSKQIKKIFCLIIFLSCPFFLSSLWHQSESNKFRDGVLVEACSKWDKQQYCQVLAWSSVTLSRSDAGDYLMVIVVAGSELQEWYRSRTLSTLQVLLLRERVLCTYYS